jgi:hypothetical protein
MSISRSAFHWHPVRSTKKMASIAARSGTLGLWQPSGCFGRGGGSGSISAHSVSGSRQPSSRTRRRLRLIDHPDRARPSYMKVSGFGPGR